VSRRRTVVLAAILGAPLFAAIALLALFLLAPKRAHASPLTPRWEVGVLGGWSLPDRGLDDFAWDVSPHPSWGAQALATLGPAALGLRYTRSSTTQDLGAASSVASARVRSSALELVARGDLVGLEGFGGGLYAVASAGRLHLGYDPDRVTMDTGSGPVDVELAPVGTWTYGGGLGVKRGLAAGWNVALETTHRRFELDTAHRNGGEVTYERRNFGEWSARVALSRRIP
jgi:hypothetical protein